MQNDIHILVIRFKNEISLLEIHIEELSGSYEYVNVD